VFSRYNLLSHWFKANLNALALLKGLVEQPGSKERQAFEGFLKELRNNLNDSVTDDEAIEMLAQHLITKPVFETLFQGYSFTQENPVSRAIQTILDVLEERNLAKESKSLEKFYNSVRTRAAGIETAQGKQRLVVELYEKFFRKAFPRMTERLGIVYTPVEVVDFIIHSVNDVLQNEFGQTLGSQGVHIIDPFVGTGTFITRLLQSGLIKPEELADKYKHEIHANELVLLAYYIAAINIEAVYHSLIVEHAPFGGICLADTFQLDEKQQGLFSQWMTDNTKRRDRQKAQNIRVIIGNPPYSTGQNSTNDNNANLAYPCLDERIRETYAKYSSATNKNALYDSYIRAIRWVSDRLGESGVMAYVSNAGWIDGNAMDGLRKCLVEEFSSLYIFHLRGNARTSGEQRRMEKDNVFGQGTRTPIAITLFVKNPDVAAEYGKIYYRDIGDYLSQKDKLWTISDLGSINGISRQNGWQTITPDENHDWLNQRDNSFDEFISIGDKRDKTTLTVFEDYSRGLATGRDAWCYNPSKRAVESKMERMIEFYNEEVKRFRIHGNSQSVDTFINTDASKISWNRGLKNDLERNKKHQFISSSIVNSVYRPFTKQWVYFSRPLNDMIYKMPRIFPHAEAQNRVIAVTGIGANRFSALMMDVIPDLNTMIAGQCFPLKLYEPITSNTADLYADNETSNGYRVRDGITDRGLAHFQTAYPDESISKEDIFYYIYGLLHSEEYRNRYSNNLSKQLPRIPCVKRAKDFWAFSEAGRKLADLHVNYESVEPYPVNYKGGGLLLDELTDADYRVGKKWKFGGKAGNWDKTTVIYNHKITMTNIPLQAYDYVVNGKPALEWVMERQVVKTDKASGIVNDANRYAIETVGDAAYPLKLFQRVITVSLKTMEIVRGLPKLEIEDEPNFVEIAKGIASAPVKTNGRSEAA
jgi:predicted helicase